LTLVEYGDYECPFCARAHPVVVTLLQTLGNELRFGFRHFPVTTTHPHAQKAAEAAEAAGAQDHYWQIHDLLFGNQYALSDPDLVRYAGELGLDIKRFADELEWHVHRSRVREDFLTGVRSGVNRTPTFFINGVRHDDGFDLPTLTAALEAARAYSST
jgi:protein-disulfide isomerase